MATDLAEELARRGVPFHRAHQIVGQLVLESVRSGKRPRTGPESSSRNSLPNLLRSMARLLKPLEGMKTRSLPGGTAPETVAGALNEADSRLAVMRRQIPFTKQ